MNSMPAPSGLFYARRGHFHMNRRLAAIAVCLALSACGGGGGSPTTVEIYGDSIFTAPGISTPPAQQMRNLRPSWQIADRSVTGQSLFRIVAGMTPASAFVVIELGGNDALYLRTPEQYRADLVLAIEKVRAAGGVPVLTGIVNLPISEAFTSEVIARRDELNGITHAIAKEYGLQHAGWGEDYRGEVDVIFDRIHRTQEASDRLAALLVQAIERGAE